MIRILIILILLTGCSKPKIELKAMDNFWDKITQNSTPAEKD